MEQEGLGSLPPHYWPSRCGAAHASEMFSIPDLSQPNASAGPHSPAVAGWEGSGGNHNCSWEAVL